MRIRTQLRHRSAWAAVALTLVAGACDRLDRTLTQPPGGRRALAIEVSTPDGRAGDRVAVAISNESTFELGGVQGYLRFDPSRLRYRGQVRDAGGEQIMLVNASRADQGELRIAALDAEGIERTASMVFDVVGSDYASRLSFQVEEAAVNGSRVSLVDLDVDQGARTNMLLSRDASASRMSASDWLKALRVARGGANFQLGPGAIRNGLKYGDTNLDGNITLTDAVYIINVSVGLNEMLVGADGTGPLGERDAVVAGNVFPFNDPGLGEIGDAAPPGLEANGSRAISIGDGVAIINESVGLDQPIVGQIIPGRPATPASNRIVVSGNITTNTTWTNGNIYELSGAVNVINGATLTIQAGTRIEGQSGSGPGVGGSALFIQRDGKIIADGTALQPITFTCASATKTKGCWGGLVINGSAHTNDGTLTSPVIPGRSETGGCREKAGEGASGMYGGCNDDDNSGILRYVVIDYAGFRFTTENELNGLALQGVGRGTTVDFVQIHGGLDDGIEMFGGSVNLKHLVLTANEDDGFDYTEGYNGKSQFVIIQHDPLDSDKGTENDNFEFNHDAAPRSTPTIYNATLIGKPDPASTAGTPNNNSIAAFNVRRGARPHYFNFYVQNWRAVLDIDDDATCVDFGTATGFELKSSIFAANLNIADPDGGDPAGCAGGEEAAINLAGANNTVTATSTLLSPLNFMVPDWRPAFGTATGGATPPNDGFFDVTATYIGAVPPANATKSNIPWYSGWTHGWQNATTP